MDFAWKLRKVKERDWNKDRAETLEQIKIASKPIRKFMEELVEDINNS